jgi:hypothetical protein
MNQNAYGYSLFENNALRVLEFTRFQPRLSVGDRKLR